MQLHHTVIAAGRCCGCSRTGCQCSCTELLDRLRHGDGVSVDGDVAVVVVEAVVPAHESFLQVGQGLVTRCPVLVLFLIRLKRQVLEEVGWGGGWGMGGGGIR